LDKAIPKVSIGVPVYNGAATLGPMLDALLAQTFRDFEIVISDNASTDATAAICADFAARDVRVRVVRQKCNIGPERNFKYVLQQARAPYFMWSAADDFRSSDYLEENVRFLDAHPDYVGSTCPNRIEGRTSGDDPVTFSLEGTAGERMTAFFDYCWVSHGIFYAVARTEVVRRCALLGQRFFAADWAVNLFLARHGNIHRTAKGLMVSAGGGASMRENPWRQYYTQPFDFLLPLHRVTRYALALSSGLPFRDRLAVATRLLRLNCMMARYQTRSELRTLYHAYRRQMGRHE
jgi:glycosyltransferase involved in cell wall biosynthesis